MIVSHDRDLLDRVVTRVVELDPVDPRLARVRRRLCRIRARAGARAPRRVRRVGPVRLRAGAARGTGSAARQVGRPRGDAAAKEEDARHPGQVRARARTARPRREAARAVGARLRLQRSGPERGRRCPPGGAVVERSGFRLGPLDLDLRRGERLAIVGPNGSGKSTLLAALLGRLPLTDGPEHARPMVVVAELEQDRGAFSGSEPLLGRFAMLAGMRDDDARTLLAKFGLGAEDVLRRACDSLSPGERTRGRWRSSRRMAPTCSSSTSRPTTSTSRRSSSWRRRSQTTTARSSPQPRPPLPGGVRRHADAGVVSAQLRSGGRIDVARRRPTAHREAADLGEAHVRRRRPQANGSNMTHVLGPQRVAAEARFIRARGGTGFLPAGRLLGAFTWLPLTWTIRVVEAAARLPMASLAWQLPWLGAVGYYVILIALAGPGLRRSVERIRAGLGWLRTSLSQLRAGFDWLRSALRSCRSWSALQPFRSWSVKESDGTRRFQPSAASLLVRFQHGASLSCSPGDWPAAGAR